MATCANGHEVSPSWAFCPTCGAPVGEPGVPSGLAAPLAGSSGAEEAGAEPNVPPPSGVADPTYAPPPAYQGAGYPPPYQPGGYPPPYQPGGYPPPYQPGGYPAPLPRTNGFAIASLVLGILWILGLGSILALIFGLVGRKQIDRSGGRQRGRGLAIAGIVLGTVGIIGTVLLFVLGAVANNGNSTSTAPPSTVPSAGTTPYVLTASDAGFMATFPAKPQRLQRTVGSLTLILYLATGPNETEENVGVTYIPVPTSTGFSLDGGIASAAGDLEGRVLSHSRLTYEGQPAEDGVITFSDGTAQVRVVEFGSSGYVLEGSGPSASTFARDYDILLSTFRHSSAPTPRPTGSTTTQTPQTSLTTPGSGNGSLGSEIIPAPAGFELAQGFGLGNGPMNAADFDSFVGTKGLATTLHFVSGFSATYNSNQSKDSTEVTLFRFATPQDATDFLIRILSGQTSRPDPDISGGAEYDSTAADNTGFYHHGVLATKGAVFMAVDYGNGNASRPTLVDTMARQQYANL